MRRNPPVEGASERMWAAVEARRQEGKRRAATTEAAIRSKMDPDRYQPTWAMRNMIKALEIAPYLNTVDDWQRYYEARYIQRLRRARRRR